MAVNLWHDRKARLILTANFLLVVGSGITWIAVPWLLIHEPNGYAIYGLSSSALTLLVFLLLPVLGKVIDRNSRKKVVLVYYLFGIAANLVVISMIILQGRVEPWHLVAAMSFGSLGVSLYYPAQFALNQEVLTKDQYRALSGALEVQWQTGAMVAGAAASFLVTRIPLIAILLFDCCTFLAAFIVMAFIPYSRNPKLDANSGSALKLTMEGLIYLKRRPRLSLVLFGSFLPFLGVMVCIYLMPVFVSETLRAGPEIYGFAEVCYSLGAVLAGLTIPGLSTRIGLMRTLLLTVGCYTVAVMVNPLFAAIPVLLASLVLQGWGNAGSRVARSTVALETVPNELMGRVNLFYSAAERLLRSIFLVVVTGQVADSGPRSGYWTISAIGLSGWVMILFSRRFRRDPVIAITRRERAA
ncbi:MAG: MFS transporter [Verrucomicrobia bacterium]|nr:MFS transporter [Verrucomicrobiota bacterium]